MTSLSPLFSSSSVQSFKSESDCSGFPHIFWSLFILLLYNNSFELRSIIFQEFPFETLSKILSFLGKNNCRTTAKAGLHFHFSGMQLEYNDIIKLTKQIVSMRVPKKERKTYCLRKDSSTYHPIIGIDPHSYHYECRIFNASLKLRAIYQNWLTLTKMLGTVGVSPATI